MTPFGRALPLLTALLVAGGLLAVSLPAARSEAATATTLCKSQTAAVDGGAYTLENNEWGSSEPECITTDGTTHFAVANSSIANSTYAAPGGYPAIYKGCHWGACTRGSGFPIQVSDIRAGTVTTSWSTAQPGGSSDYDVAYDIWFNQTPTTSGQPNGTELMIWLNHHGPVQPFGSHVASNVSVGGRGYNVWFGNQGWNTLSYTMTTPATSVSNLDLQPLIADAVSRGYIKASWYLIDVEAGTELWQGGAGLATNSFSVKVAGGGTSLANSTPTSPNGPSAAASLSGTPTSPSPSAPASPSATPTSPFPSSSASPFPTLTSPFPTSSSPSPSATPTSPFPSSTASPFPAPTSPSPTPSSPSAPATASPSATPTSPFPSSTASPFPTPTSPSPTLASPSPTPTQTPNISLQAISPDPPKSGTSTNVTVDFKNNGSTTASNLTLVTDILNSAGTVVGSQSQSGQNVAPQETLNVSYAWTAASPGTYTIEGLVQDPSGTTLEHAQVGTVTVN